MKLSEKIKNKTLQNKVKGVLKDLRLSNKEFRKYPKEKITRAGSVFVVPTAGLGPVERNLLEHTVTLTELCIKASECFKKNYGIELDMDSLIAASILHDLMKVFEYKRNEHGELEPTGIMLDHSMLGVAELYSRNFPEEVIHIIASHFGEGGPTPPRTFEAIIFHHLDSLTSIIEYYHKGKEKLNEQILLLTEKDLKRLGEKPEKSK
jgi:7,8-dihydroneopterin 2',3'-cyclic phosphate phosphodiesterase